MKKYPKVSFGNVEQFYLHYGQNSAKEKGNSRNAGKVPKSIHEIHVQGQFYKKEGNYLIAPPLRRSTQSSLNF